ncbi:uncharacterized protein LOC131679851 [Topomyia yanbarensis]|uniref:uncharacterized protein LOC131679851 n=1 Tax=Topomyia yanbarensis TaxID=2498891 RepID=UPI00273CC5CF|nr:uncharacterized protein LOC131679851 [Topomyia yanbarensis]
MIHDPGGGGPSSSFGSRFEWLNNDEIDNNDTPKVQRQKTKKRLANREATNETQFTKYLRIDGKNNGPRYLILSRVDPDTSMKNVSPFFIKKAVDAITPNVRITRIQDGTLLLQTVDKQQADKLLKQSLLGNQIKIKITDHPTLNTTKGTISCYDLKFLTDKEILEGLSDSHVVGIQRIKRKNSNKELEDTSVFVLTFNLSYLPDSIDVGFYPCRIVAVEIGSAPTVLSSTTMKLSVNKSVNCRGSHSALSRECPVFMDEFEIQRIRVTDRVNMKDARRKRRLQAPAVFVPQLNQSFSEVVRHRSNDMNVQSFKQPQSQNIPDQTLHHHKKQSPGTTPPSGLHENQETQIRSPTDRNNQLHQPITSNTIDNYSDQPIQQNEKTPKQQIQPQPNKQSDGTTLRPEIRQETTTTIAMRCETDSDDQLYQPISNTTNGGKDYQRQSDQPDSRPEIGGPLYDTTPLAQLGKEITPIGNERSITTQKTPP